MAHAEIEGVGTVPWYRALDRAQWKALLAANLGWTFDGFEIYALILTVGLALKQLLEPAQLASLPAYAGMVIAINVFGWGVGGLIGGIVADYLGRKRTMMLAIAAYSLTTALSAFAWDWVSFACLRLLVGIAIGSEWVTGASMVAELWPDEARGKGGGFMQCGAGIGNFIAAAVWLGVGASGPGAWRYMYLIGVLPALLTLWIRRGVPESHRWERADERRRAARERKRSGVALGDDDVAFTRFTLVDLFAERAVRGRLFLSLAMVVATVIAWWGIASWIPPYVGSVAAKAGRSATEYAALAGMIYNGVGILGYVFFGFAADAVGRKPVTMLFFAMGLLLTPALFLWAQDLDTVLWVTAVNGFFTLGIWAWAPIWLPELYPTRMRATAVAFSFNAPRLIACIGPLVAGTLIVALGGYGHAATIIGSIYVLGLICAPFLPETRAKPLPETV
jgi:MFS family permease